MHTLSYAKSIQATRRIHSQIKPNYISPRLIALLKKQTSGEYPKKFMCKAHNLDGSLVVLN